MKLKMILSTLMAATLISACQTTQNPDHLGTRDEAYRASPGTFKPPASQAEAAAALSGLLAAETAGVDLAERAAQIEAAQAHPLGSWDNPVRSELPEGQRAYLNRLRCEDGSRPSYRRRGNLGPGIYGTIVDLYDLQCRSSQPATAEVVMDMYHQGHIERDPVPGFDIVIIDTASGPGT